jgi:putative thioredoxin
MNSLSGAFDLSQRPEPESIGIPGWLVSANEQVFKSYLELSTKLPVLLLISSAQTQDSVRAAVTSALSQAQGRFAGLEISAEANPRLVEAIGITATDALVAILMGQPAVISQGGVDVEKLPAILTQLAQLAEQNGLTGRARVVESNEPALSPEHEIAYQALARGDFDAARSAYQQILASAPGDQMARSGLAQVELMIRLQGTSGDETFDEADQLIANANPAAAFALILDEFVLADPERRESLRQRLIELFLLFSDDDANVLAARRRLSSLLF